MTHILSAFSSCFSRNTQQLDVKDKKHKIVNRTKKKIETRVQRSVVLEDGKIVADTGPQTITRTFEDQDNDNVENERSKGDFSDNDSDFDTMSQDEEIFDNQDENAFKRRGIKYHVDSDCPKHVSLNTLPVVRRVSNIRRKNKKASREVSHFHDEKLRDITDPEEVERALKSPADFLDKIDNEFIDDLSGHKLRFYSQKSKKVKEKDKVSEVSHLDPNGVIRTNTTRCHAIEEVSDEEMPESYANRLIDSITHDGQDYYSLDNRRRSHSRNRSLPYGDFYFGFDDRPTSSSPNKSREVASDWVSPHFPARSDWKTIKVYENKRGEHSMSYSCPHILDYNQEIIA